MRIDVRIECGCSRVLFDTGQTDAFARNARVLGIDLSRADAIVLSHGHYDHSGGLAKAMQIAPAARVYLHPGALKPKFTRHADGKVHDVGLGPTAEQLHRSARVVLTERPTELVPGLFVTGPVRRRNDFEDTGGSFYQDAACTRPDPLSDDQAMYFRRSKGTVVLLRCAHAGVINTLNHVRDIGGGPIHAIIGGMHLLSASDQRLAATLDALQEHGDQILAPAHCTGTKQKLLLCIAIRVVAANASWDRSSSLSDGEDMSDFGKEYRGAAGELGKKKTGCLSAASALGRWPSELHNCSASRSKCQFRTAR